MEKEVKNDAPTSEEISEKDLLKQAEEREKARKEQEEAEKVAQKEEEKKQKTEEREEKLERKTQQRRKPRHGKKYRKIAEKIEKNKEYSIDDAINLVLETNVAKFDAAVDLHVKINSKEKATVRGMVVLPGGATKQKTIKEVTAENIENVIADVKAGKIDFDLMIVDVKIMPKIAQLAKILGPKGLMPSPKAGTVVEDVKKAAAELKGGKVEYRADKTNIVHISIGRVSFGMEKIKSNFEAIFEHLPKKIDSIYLTTSMGPSIKVSKK